MRTYRNQFTVAAIVGTIALGALAILPGQTSLPLRYEQAIGGNTTMQDAPACYLTICLPKNWESDPLSQQLLASTANPNFARLRRFATTKIYVDGQLDFEHRFQSDSNSGPVQTLPAVLVQSNGQTQKWSGENVLRAETELDHCIRHILNRPKPEPEPAEPPEEPNEEPVPDLPDVTSETPLVTDEDNTLGIVLSALAGGVVAWLAMFSRKT